MHILCALLIPSHKRKAFLSLQIRFLQCQDSRSLMPLEMVVGWCDIKGMPLGMNCYVAHPLQDGSLQVSHICVAFLHQLFSILAAPQASSAAPCHMDSPHVSSAVTYGMLASAPMHDSMHVLCTKHMHAGTR